LSTTTRGRAQVELEYGGVKVHPHLDFSATYDDNIFIAPRGQEKSDLYFTISPGMHLLYGNQKRNFLSLDYTAGIQRFTEHTSEDTLNHAVTFSGQASLDKFTLSLTHVLTDIRGANIEVGERVGEFRNVTQGAAEYRLSPKTSVGVNYRQEFHHFDKNTFIDWQSYEPSGTFYYHVTPKTHILGQFDYGWVTVNGGRNDAQYQELDIGVRTLPSSKLVGTIKGGYQHRDFSGPADTINAWVASATLEANFTDRTSAELNAIRNISPSITATDNNYTLTRVMLTLRQKLWNKRLVVSVGGGYEHDDYKKQFNVASPPAVQLRTRRDDYWEGNLGVDYNIARYFQVGASYRYRENNSSIDSVSFGNHITSVHLLLHF
jgi:opacity protein-like surface antigen